MNKLKVVLVFIIIIAVIGSFLYWVASNANQQKIDRIEKVEEGYKYSKGIITDIHSYKGHSIEINYNIEGINYIYSGGWDYNPKKLNVNDSILFKYSTSDPKLIITELETKY
ncbi:hypothetical protein ASU31_07240 [Pedobacter ginsenosidimutans]|uniref:DUF3592 domain-containing protein n=1 Tax=Pedobacter ginsenosidimutans TaxID=687842 RepID=A0A0T5VS26_9SPHI|nr:hypothetical protein [Pedobacter ginsenosidimutans]KRT16605.1 hypothetical protein ASU31_07240 [Pedobacter ginsenosidimutans]